MAEKTFLSGLFRKPEPIRPVTPTLFPDLRKPEKGFVFLVSYGQSGDVLLQETLNAASGVVVRGENGNLLRPLSRAWHHAEATVLQAFAERAPDAEKRMRDLTMLGWHLADSFVRDVLALPQTVVLAGFREIRYHGNAEIFQQQLDFMASFFPNARFVFNTRDPRETAGSGWWREQDSAGVIKTLSAADQLFATFAHHHPEISYQLNYDNYARDPDQLSGLFDWLDVPAPEKKQLEEIVTRHRVLLEAEAPA